MNTNIFHVKLLLQANSLQPSLDLRVEDGVPSPVPVSMIVLGSAKTPGRHGTEAVLMGGRCD